jgi:hypothetical protein
MEKWMNELSCPFQSYKIRYATKFVNSTSVVLKLGLSGRFISIKCSADDFLGRKTYETQSYIYIKEPPYEKILMI